MRWSGRSKISLDDQLALLPSGESSKHIRLTTRQMTPPAPTQAASTEADREACLLRLSQYSPDAPGAQVPYSLRLAEAEGWSRLHTLTVIEEYKRFAYLAVFAGHPVTPSEAIDAAWHLHLQYSEEYWTVFCGEGLRAPLRQVPGIGAPDEDDAYAQRYQQTMESYRRVFGVEPPADVWPEPEPAQEHSAPDDQGFVARRPRKAVTPTHVSTTRRIMPFVWPVIGISLLAVTAYAAPDFKVLDYSGPLFLAFYLGLCVIACLSIKSLHRFAYWRRPQGQIGGSMPRDLEPDEAALMTAGAGRMAQVAALSLLDAGAVRVVHPPKRRRDRNTYAVANEQKPPKRHVNAWTWLSQQKQHRSRWLDFQNRLAGDAPEMTDRLRDEGWMWASGAMTGTTLTAWAIALPILWLGAVKVFIGLGRERPVMWLLIEMAVFAIVYWRVTAGLAGVGRAGPTAAAEAAIDVQRQRGQQGGGLSATDLLWMTAFAGTSVLANTAWAGYRVMLGGPGVPVGTGGGSDTSSSCSSGSNGSSSCGSSGCGSSGCGGCSSSS